ncbi:HIT family protein [Rhodanobacter ginsengisoli]|uniref:HIT family protein n=1 Tax=Rhodanobacter ginsengisoli TaxID=418646 RepID=A0ABW0QUN5_9GAMM
MTAAACPFCAIAAGDAPASVIHDDGKVLAFMDLRQAVPGHVLVVPRKHVPDLYALDDGEAAGVMQVAVRVARALREAYHVPGLNLWQSNGEAGGQEVLHFHLHVHPRRPGDGLLRVYPQGSPPCTGAEELEAMARSLRSRLQS